MTNETLADRLERSNRELKQQLLENAVRNSNDAFMAKDWRGAKLWHERAAMLHRELATRETA